MLAVNWSDCENVQEHSSKIKSYMNNVNVCTDVHSSGTGSSTMPRSEYTYYQLQCIAERDHWRFHTQLICGKIHTQHK